MKRNKTWDFEEMVAMVDIYMRHKNCTNTRTLKEDLEDLSIALNKRADMLGIEKGENYRNYNGMNMIYHNLMSADTNGEKGLRNGSKLMLKVLDFYKEHHAEFETLLKHFNDNYSNYFICMISFVSALLIHKLN